MSAISRETQDLLRRQAILATEEAAKRDGVSVDADALAVLSQPGLLFVVAPIAGIEKLDFKALLDGGSVLDDRPLMYWHLSSDRLGGAKGAKRAKGAEGAEGVIPAGFYTVVADHEQGEVRLVDASGSTAARGSLTVVIDPPPAVATAKTSGKVTSVNFGKNSIKLCGEVSVEVSTPLGSATVKVEACVEVKW